MAIGVHVRSERAGKVAMALACELPERWDGRASVLELQAAAYQWRQMEWIGWYFEWKAGQILSQELGGGRGPRFGNVAFDHAVDGQVWDFKAHPVNQSAHWAYMNDVEAVDACIARHGHIGWVIAAGHAAYDIDGSFKAWHDTLKGDRTPYEMSRIARGAPSRRRKVSFSVEHLLVIELRSMADVAAGIRDGWLSCGMQAGQRNADGSSRRAKYGVHVERWLRGP